MILARTLEDNRHILLRIPQFYEMADTGRSPSSPPPMTTDEWVSATIDQINQVGAEWIEVPISEVAEFAVAQCRRAARARRFVVVDFATGAVEIDGVLNHLRVLRLADA